MAKIHIIEVGANAVTVITDVPNARLDGKSLSSFSKEAQAGFTLFCEEALTAFLAAQETYEAKERQPGTPEYNAKQLLDAQAEIERLRALVPAEAPTKA